MCAWLQHKIVLQQPDLPLVLTKEPRKGKIEEQAYPMELVCFAPGQEMKKLPPGVQVYMRPSSEHATT